MVTCLGRESQYVELSFLFRNDLILRDISRINHVMVTWNYSEGSHHGACHTAQSDHNLSKQDSQPSVAHQVQYHQTPVRNNEKPWGTGIKKKDWLWELCFPQFVFQKINRLYNFMQINLSRSPLPQPTREGLVRPHGLPLSISSMSINIAQII